MNTSNETSVNKPVLVYRRSNNHGGIYDPVQLGESVIEDILKGGGITTRYLMVNYTDPETHLPSRYPLNLLFKTAVERTLNSTIRGLPPISEELVNVMRRSVEEVVHKLVDQRRIKWSFNHPRIDCTERQVLATKVDDLPVDLLDVLGYYICKLQRTRNREDAFYYTDTCIEYIEAICGLIGYDFETALQLFETETKQWR